MSTNYCIVYCTVPDYETAEKLAKVIVGDALAACVNVIPGLTSFYQWEGELKQGKELLLMIKTHREKLSALESKVVALHPYEFPEFITTPIIQGNQNYLDWLGEVVGNLG